MKGTAVEIEISDCGELITPNLHDSKLTMIKVDQGEAEFIFKLVSGELIIAKFDGVYRLRCNNFLEANIVLDMSIITKCLVEQYELERLLIPPVVLLDKHEVYIKKIQEKLLQGELSFVEINNSYGCQAYILCKTVQFYSKRLAK